MDESQEPLRAIVRLLLPEIAVADATLNRAPGPERVRYSGPRIASTIPLRLHCDSELTEALPVGHRIGKRVMLAPAPGTGGPARAPD